MRTSKFPILDYGKDPTANASVKARTGFGNTHTANTLENLVIGLEAYHRALYTKVSKHIDEVAAIRGYWVSEYRRLYELLGPGSFTVYLTGQRIERIDQDLYMAYHTREHLSNIAPVQDAFEGASRGLLKPLHAHRKARVEEYAYEKVMSHKEDRKTEGREPMGDAEEEGFIAQAEKDACTLQGITPDDFRHAKGFYDRPPSNPLGELPEDALGKYQSLKDLKAQLRAESKQ